MPAVGVLASSAVDASSAFRPTTGGLQSDTPEAVPRPGHEATGRGQVWGACGDPAVTDGTVASWRSAELKSVKSLGAKSTGSARKPVGQLPGEQRASILIGRAAYFGSKLLLLDEPTAALGVEQSAAVARMVNAIAATGLPPQPSGNLCCRRSDRRPAARREDRRPTEV